MRTLRRSFSVSNRLRYETVKLEYRDKLALLSFNRPKNYNAMNGTMYNEIQDVLLSEAQNENTSMLAIIGEGKFYSSGNDLKAMMANTGDLPIPERAQRAADNHIGFTDAFIDFPKPLASLVNGPAIGIGCTHLGSV